MFLILSDNSTDAPADSSLRRLLRKKYCQPVLGIPIQIPKMAKAPPSGLQGVVRMLTTESSSHPKSRSSREREGKGWLETKDDGER